MKLTARARTAVTAMADIAAYGEGAPVPLSEVAKRQVLSVPFLEQVFGQLRRAGLVESRRGAGGGYVLSRDPATLSLAEVVAAVDETVRTTACPPGGEVGCTGTSARCLTHGLWRELDGHIEGFLAGKSLADVAKGAPVHG
ncbi:Rrf2 family transcriptional regulator [Parvularcula oceani]|uniref:Rrf2 family transcriptional regulator n=1 Tax=Parvularcula oceani TaxID=1247963 RepID=UPI00192E6E02|nr:RrF2 family transcriptional regulator [Parvularcula oceani]